LGPFHKISSVLLDSSSLKVYARVFRLVIVVLDIEHNEGCHLGNDIKYIGLAYSGYICYAYDLRKFQAHTETRGDGSKERRKEESARWGRKGKISRMYLDN
jgi:hypothetical protein